MSRRRSDRAARTGNRHKAKAAPEEAPSAQPSFPIAKGSGKGRGKFLAAAAGAVAGIAALGTAFFAGKHDKNVTAAQVASDAHPTEVTFNDQIFPILRDNCVTCHRPGRSAPFPLTTFAETRKHAKQIAEVTASRYMPPWLPEHGYGEFAGERRLSDDDIAAIQRWVARGAPEGPPRELPPLQGESQWPLGQPDLIVQMPEYELPAEGKDIYHNFVVPIPVKGNRIVRGVTFLPGNPRVVHHSFIQVDETKNSRRRAAHQQPPGFDGMDLPESALMPGGQLLGWQPGKTPYVTPGLGWLLRTNSDLVLQVHMNPSGKIEKVQPSVGFYFTDEIPTNTPFRIKLAALRLNIPAGESNYVAEESYTLPVSVSLMRVGAHAHYIAKDMQAYALLPDGQKKWLLWIKNWDFKWQGDYGYAQPVELPPGSRLVLHYTYDNSTNNPRNPNNPPKRVIYGLQSADEMGELYFQALTRDRTDYVTLARDYSRKLLNDSLAFFRFRIDLDAKDADAHARLGRLYAGTGQNEPALAELNRALELNPANAGAHFDMGSLFLREKKFAEAAEQFKTAAKLDPDDAQSIGSLGIISLQLRQPEEARNYFRRALAIDADDALAAKYLHLLEASLPHP